MSTPIVYDVVLRAEVRATDEQAALAQVAAYIRANGIDGLAVTHGVEVIRDDALVPGGRDDESRKRNGFVVLSGFEKRDLLARIASSAEAAARDDQAPGKALLAELAERFRYGYRRPE